MVYRGRIDRGTILWEGESRPPDGAIVAVVLVEQDHAAGPGGSVYRLDELAVPTGIPDFALNVDHYLYGHPKVAHAQP